MKNTFKFLGAITLIAVIAFAFLSCGGMPSMDFGGGGAGAFGGMGAVSAEWPSDDSWAQYGLAGLTQPPNTTIAFAGSMPGGAFTVSMEGNRAAFDNLVSQIERLGFARYSQEEIDRGTIAIGYGKATTEQGLVVSFSSNDNVIGLVTGN